MMSLDRLPQYQVKTPYFAVVVAVFKCEQDEEHADFMQGAYKTYVTKTTRSTTPYYVIVVAVFKYEQDKEREYSAQGAYLNIRDQAETERNVVLRNSCSRFQIRARQGV